MIKQLIYLFLSLFLLLGCTKKKSNTAQTEKTNLPYKMVPPKEKMPVLSNKYINENKKIIEQFFKDNWTDQFENISFLVAKDGQLIYEKYEGFANKEKNILLTAQTPLHIASVSKVFTASAILKLVEAKKLNLDQKLYTILRAFPYKDVTIRTLLNHRSGLVKYSNYVENNKVWNKNKILTNNELLKILIKHKPPLDYPTNTHFVYNNTNYALLALVIEKITKMQYPEAMKAIIFDPLNMKNTFVFDYKHPQKNVTPSYKWNYEKYSFDYLDAIYGDKNIYSTPQDLLKFDNARNAKEFLSTKLLNEVFKGYSYESKGTKNYGLGIRIKEWDNKTKLYFHNGWWHGNTSSYTTLRDENVVIIALSNKFTRKTYHVNRLSVLFGDYPFTLKDTIHDGEY